MLISAVTIGLTHLRLSHMRPTSYFEGPIDKLNWHVLKLLWPYLLEYKGRITLAMSCLVVAKLASVALPFILKQLVDTLDDDKNNTGIKCSCWPSACLRCGAFIDCYYWGNTRYAIWSSH